jgi:hypothetical protein
VPCSIFNRTNGSLKKGFLEESTSCKRNGFGECRSSPGTPFGYRPV